MKTIAIIVAGGKGKRMKRPKSRYPHLRGKQFLKIAGKPMIEWTLSAFQKSKVIDGIILVVAKEALAKARQLRFSKIIKVVAGGAERSDSVKNGLKELPDSTNFVVIHDGARPAVTEELINRSIRAARKYGAALLGVPVKDTIKTIDRQRSTVDKTLNREKLWQAQTPQTFRASIIKKAYEKLRGKVTDDAMAVEKSKIPVKIVMGSYENIKVTTPEDIKIIEAILRKKRK